jgi:hypothetical protein
MVRIIAVGVGLAVASVAAGQTDVLTRSYDNARDGATTHETHLTPGSVSSRGFTRIKSLCVKDSSGDCKLDDFRVEAQPLFVPGLTIRSDGKKHNVIFVATMGNHVLAVDADAPDGAAPLWISPELSQPYVPIPTPNNCAPGETRTCPTNVDMWGINVRWGILSTPVIDPDAQQMYLTNWTEDPNCPTPGQNLNLPACTNPVVQLHRVRLGDGTEIGHGQALCSASPCVWKDPHGQVVRDARGHIVELHTNQKSRAALLLTPARGPHKTLFIGISGGENPGDPHGWLVAVDVDTFKTVDVHPTTQRAFGGGIWQGGQGPASDDHGHVYVMTGNGGFEQNPPEQDANRGAPQPCPGLPPDKLCDFVDGTTDFAEAFIKFTLQKTNGAKSIVLDDWFIPFRDVKRGFRDQDLGAAAPILVTLPSGTNLIMGAGKDGLLYILDRDHLGRKIEDLSVLKQQPPSYITFNGTGLPTAPPPDPGQDGVMRTHHLHGSPVYWVGPSGPLLFAWGENESLRSWKLDPTSGATSFVGKSAETSPGTLETDPNGMGGMTGGMISLSSDGTSNGIVWTVAPIAGDANKQLVQGVVRAYDATQLDGVNGDTTPKLKLLYDSTQDPQHPAFLFSKFSPPVVADGKLLVATYSGRVDVYGVK